MRLAVCDRNAEDRRVLVRLLEAAFAGCSVLCAIEQYGDAADMLCDVEDGAGFAVILLELSDCEGNGLETARRLRERGYDGEIVFTSSSASFAVDGYEVGACGYLLKPYRAERLLRLVERQLSRLTHPRCLTVCHYSAVVRIPFHEIVFIESRNTKCVIHRSDGEEHQVYRRLDELEQELDDGRFLRCHQSYLVNMDRVVAVNTHFEMENGHSVAIRRRELKPLRERYLRYIERSVADL